MPHDAPSTEIQAPRRSPVRAVVAVTRFLVAWCLWLVQHPLAWNSVLSRTLVILRQGGLASLGDAVLYKAIARQSGTNANAWYQRYRRHAARRDPKRRTWPADAPLLRVIVPLDAFDEQRCDRLLRSALAQGYVHWELWCVCDRGAQSGARRCATNYATLDTRFRLVSTDEAVRMLASANSPDRELYILFGERVAEFLPAALASLAEGVASSHAEVVYGDHVIGAAAGSSAIAEVATLPGYSYEFLLTAGYFAGGAVVRGAVVDELAPHIIHTALRHDSFELLLYALEHARRVTHVPAIIARWRDATVDLAERATAVERHLARIGDSATVDENRTLGVLDVRARDARPQPAKRVAIVVPTRNAHQLLRLCVESLESSGALDQADLYLVDHQTEDPAALAYLAQLSRRHQVVRAEGDFNFSRLVNQGVAAAGPNYSHYLLLNNDIESTEPGWLQHLLAMAMRPQVGAVGATLLYPDGAIQHAGVVLGMRGLAGHYQLGARFHDAPGVRRRGPHLSLAATREVSAVTAACVLISSEAWHAVAGFDEAIAVGYGDVDFCLRLEMAGFRILHDPHAVLVHHESRTRGRAIWDPHPADTRRFLQRYRALILAGDQYYSPQLSNVLTQSQLGRAHAGAPRTSSRIVPRPVSTGLGLNDRRDTKRTLATKAAA